MYLTQGPLEHQHLRPASYNNHLLVFMGPRAVQAVPQVVHRVVPRVVPQAALQVALPLLRQSFTSRLSHPNPPSHLEPFHPQRPFKKCWNF